MNNFENVLICTDLDGTLLRSDRTISSENIQAIEYFKSKGGYFTFITGRMPYYVYDMYYAIKPNAPIGCINGGGLYDFRSEKYIWTNPMTENIIPLIECIDNAFPNIGIQINTLNDAYFCKDNETMRIFRRATNLPNLNKSYRDLVKETSKVIFGTEDEEEILAAEQMLRNHPLAEKFDFIRSEKTLFEILPKGTNKGVSILKLAEYLKIDVNKTIAIGDYNNDISMFKAAKIGIAVENACPDAKAAADIITVTNDEHAIAKVIYDLECGNIKF